MKLIIDIPEEAYNLLKTSSVDLLGALHILDAVSKGVSLPQGHGRLLILDSEVEISNSVVTIIEADKTMRGEADDNRESNSLEK